MQDMSRDFDNGKVNPKVSAQNLQSTVTPGPPTVPHSAAAQTSNQIPPISDTIRPTTSQNYSVTTKNAPTNPTPNLQSTMTTDPQTPGNIITTKKCTTDHNAGNIKSRLAGTSSTPVISDITKTRKNLQSYTPHSPRISRMKKTSEKARKWTQKEQQI